MQTAQGNLTMIGMNTISPKVFWNGAEVTGIKCVRVHNDDDEVRVSIRLVGNQDEMYVEMMGNGILIKKVTV